jgi:phage terminase large subunit-like protein
MESIRSKLIQDTSAIVKKIIHKRWVKYDWNQNARADQMAPQEWGTWLILAGRGFGKTRTGAETVRKLIEEQNYRRICLLGETINEVRRIMIEGNSGILNIYPHHERPKYYPSLNMIVWKNGAVAHGFSAENTESLRGPEFDLVWIDELAKFPNPEECLNQVKMTMRIGDPKLIITTTPKPIKVIKELSSDCKVHVTRGTTLDNKQNLSANFIDSILQEYGNSKFGLQEIYGEIVENDCVQLWHKNNIMYTDQNINEMEDVVIAVDPAVTFNHGSDETGIIVVGRKQNKFYVFDDKSIKSSVLDWASVVVSLSYLYNNSAVVIEINQGGNLAKELILQIDPRIKIHEVRASKSKMFRAQPISALYNRGLVLHAKKLPELERQMLEFATLNHSPDRVDAMIWGITYLNHRKPSFRVV